MSIHSECGAEAVVGLTDRVRTIVADVRGTPVEQVQSSTHLAALGLDSLDRLVLAVQVEQTFAVTVPDPVLVGWCQVRDVVTHVTAVGEHPA